MKCSTISRVTMRVAAGALAEGALAAYNLLCNPVGNLRHQGKKGSLLERWKQVDGTMKQSMLCLSVLQFLFTNLRPQRHLGLAV